MERSRAGTAAEGAAAGGERKERSCADSKTREDSDRRNVRRTTGGRSAGNEYDAVNIRKHKNLR